MGYRLGGRVAIVTGGGSGIGAATARELAVAERCQVAIFDIDAKRADAQAEAIRLDGGDAIAVEVDVSDQDAVGVAVDRVAELFGGLHCLVNSAVSFVAKGLDATTADWGQSLMVNVAGGANLVQACIPHMRDGSAIVNVSSVSAHVAQPNRWTYNAGKAAITNLTRCQALDLAPKGIRVNSVAPGWIWTPEVTKAAGGDREKWEPVWGRYHMLRRLGEAREVARAICFLLSDDASFITATEIMVDGGYRGLGSEGLGEDSKFAGSQ